MPNPPDELRARDLVRRRDLPRRDPVGHQTVRWLVSRAYRRPAGCSERLYKAMSTEDPFERPPDIQGPDERPLYVAKRFVRIDNAQKAASKKPGLPVEKKAPSWMQKLQELREENDAKKAEKGMKKPPSQVHTPNFSAPADPLDPAQRRPPPPAEVPRATETGRFRARPQRSADPSQLPATGTEEVDRTPPRIAAPTPTAHAPTRARRAVDPGIDRTPPRIVEAPQQPTLPARARRKVVADGVDRRPPRIAPGAPAAPSERRAVPRARKAPPDIDRTPPRVKHVVTDENGEPLRPMREIRAARARGGALGGAGEAPLAGKKVLVGGAPPGGEGAPEAPETPSAPEPSRRPPSTGGGLDDLFGAAPEGRVRVGRRPKQDAVAAPSPEPTPAAAPTEALDRRPPRVGKAAEADAAAAEAAAQAEAEARAAGGAPGSGGLDDLFASPEPSRRPPSPGGGLDDLFGAAPEGRVRVGRRTKADADAPPPPAAPETPAEPIDRRPPRVGKAAEADAAAEAAAAAAAAEAEAEAKARSRATRASPASGDLDDLFAPSGPPRRPPSAGGGLDDLFGAAPEGRVRVGRRAKKDVDAVPEPAEEKAAPEKPTIDRTPPKFTDVDPSKLPK